MLASGPRVEVDSLSSSVYVVLRIDKNDLVRMIASSHLNILNLNNDLSSCLNVVRYSGVSARKRVSSVVALIVPCLGMELDF